MQKQFIITAVPGHQNPAAGFSKFLQQAYTYPPTILLHTYLPTYLFATFAVTCYVYTYQPTQKRFITAMPDNQKLATSLLKSLQQARTVDGKRAGVPFSLKCGKLGDILPQLHPHLLPHSPTSAHLPNSSHTWIHALLPQIWDQPFRKMTTCL